MGEGESGLKWMSDHVVEEPVSLQPTFVDGCPGDLRMDEYQGFEFLCFGPKRVKLRGRQIFSLDATSDGTASHPELLHAFLQLFGGERRKLQGHARKTHETVGMGGTKGRDFFVLNLDDLTSEVRIRPIPKGIDRHRLHIDSHFVEIGQTLS